MCLSSPLKHEHRRLAVGAALVSGHLHPRALKGCNQGGHETLEEVGAGKQNSRRRLGQRGATARVPNIPGREPPTNPGFAPSPPPGFTSSPPHPEGSLLTQPRLTHRKRASSSPALTSARGRCTRPRLRRQGPSSRLRATRGARSRWGRPAQQSGGCAH
eukprot:scaffold13614_cov101-Isochrysis_galbana.AAC.2